MCFSSVWDNVEFRQGCAIPSLLSSCPRSDAPFRDTTDPIRSRTTSDRCHTFLLMSCAHVLEELQTNSKESMMVHTWSILSTIQSERCHCRPICELPRWLNTVTIYEPYTGVNKPFTIVSTVFVPFACGFSPLTRSMTYECIVTVILPYACRKCIV